MSIWQGSNKLGEDVTGSDGAYSFPTSPPAASNVSGFDRGKDRHHRCDCG